MPLYSYSAYGHNGQQQSGQEFAASKMDLEKRLKGRKLILLECQEQRLPRFRRNQLAKLINLLSPLLNSGIVIDRALQIIAEDKTDQAASDLAEKLREGVKRGQQLSQALEALGAADPLAMTVIRAGEVSGQLPEVMHTLEQYYERRRKLRAEVNSALFYPAILVCISILSIVLLGLYVIPTFKDLFQDRIGLLPLNVRFIFGFSDLLVAAGWWILAGIVAAIAGVIYAYRHSRGMRSWWSEKVLALPVIGKFLSKIYTAQVFSLLAVQLRNGVPLISALELLNQSTPNLLIARRLSEIQNEVRRGKNLSYAMRQFPGIPILAVRFLSIGEETGKLDEMAEKAGLQLSDEVTSRSKALASILGPLIILVMGLMIAFIVISMLVAVYSITDLTPQA